MTLYRVKIAYGPWSKGHVFTNMQGNVGRLLAARGLVEEVKEEAEQPETKTAAYAAPVNRMVRAEKRGRR